VSPCANLRLEALAAERGGKKVFADINVNVEAGTLLRVLGPNGAGKTTLLRILAGLGAASAGALHWHAADGTALDPTEAALFAGHATAMNDALTVAENLSYAAALAGFDGAIANVRRALTHLGVEKLINRRVGSLSQGQRKRASLARLLLRTTPGERAWLLDEPFVALDTDTQSQLAALISQELAAGAIVVLTSHQTVSIGAAKIQELAL
jgi:heme exporter protein A